MDLSRTRGRFFNWAIPSSSELIFLRVDRSPDLRIKKSNWFFIDEVSLRVGFVIEMWLCLIKVIDWNESLLLLLLELLIELGWIDWFLSNRFFITRLFVYWHQKTWIGFRIDQLIVVVVVVVVVDCLCFVKCKVVLVWVNFPKSLISKLKIVIS